MIRVVYKYNEKIKKFNTLYLENRRGVSDTCLYYEVFVLK